MYIKTTGLILRETEYKESSRIITVLTASEGKITVLAKGAKRKGSKTAASTQLLAFSEMTLFHDRGRYTLTDARSIELFLGLRDELELMALGSYFAELLETVSTDNISDPEILTLGLNGLYALSEKKNDPRLIKAAFEMRIMCISGFEPLLDECCVCGKSDAVAPVFSVPGGVMHCMACRAESRNDIFLLSQGTLDALRHIISCDPKRLYSFTVKEDTVKQLGKICEAYLTTHLERGFSTLDFYHAIG